MLGNERSSVLTTTTITTTTTATARLILGVEAVRIVDVDTTSLEEDEEDGYILVGDEVFAKWDGDQRNYITPTPYRSALLTAKYTWKNLSWGCVESSGVCSAVGEVAKKGVAVIAAVQSPVQSVIGWQPSRNAFTVEDVSAGEKKAQTQSQRYRRSGARGVGDGFEPQKMVMKEATNLEGQPKQGHEKGDLKFRKEIRNMKGEEGIGLVFEEDVQQYDWLGVSNAWERPIKTANGAERKRRLIKEWETRKERWLNDQGGRHEGEMGGQRSHKNTVSRRYHQEQHHYDEDDNEPQKAHIGVSQSRPRSRREATDDRHEMTGMQSTAGMKRDAAVTVTIPSPHRTLNHKLGGQSKGSEGTGPLDGGRATSTTVVKRSQEGSLRLGLSTLGWKATVEVQHLRI